MNDPYALVTGASSGIGEAIAWELAKRGHHPIIHGRDEQRTLAVAQAIELAYGFKATTVLADLGTAQGTESLIAALAPYPIHVLVNNAGYSIWGRVKDLETAPQEVMMHTQLNAMMLITEQLLPAMLKMEKAHILNVSSTTIYQPIPSMAAYGATKAFIRYFSRSLRYELRNTPVNVTTLIPGSTTSRFLERAKMGALEKTSAKFAMDPKVVAQAAVKGMLNNKAEVLPGAINWISAKATGFLPTSLTIKIAAGIFEKALPKE